MRKVYVASAWSEESSAVPPVVADDTTVPAAKAAEDASNSNRVPLGLTAVLHCAEIEDTQTAVNAGATGSGMAYRIDSPSVQTPYEARE